MPCRTAPARSTRNRLTRTRNGSGLLFSLGLSFSSSSLSSSNSLRISLKSVAGLFMPLDVLEALLVRGVRGSRGPPSQPAGTCKNDRQPSIERSVERRKSGTAYLSPIFRTRSRWRWCIPDHRCRGMYNDLSRRCIRPFPCPKADGRRRCRSWTSVWRSLLRSHAVFGWCDGSTIAARERDICRADARAKSVVDSRAQRKDEVACQTRQTRCDATHQGWAGDILISWSRDKVYLNGAMLWGSM